MGFDDRVVAKAESLAQHPHPHGIGVGICRGRRLEPLRSYRGNSTGAAPDAKAVGPVAASVPAPAPQVQVSAELVEATKALSTSQQQAIDQLQIMQDLLVR